MSKTKEILKLYDEGISQRQIANRLRVSRNTVSVVIKSAAEHAVDLGNCEQLTEEEVHRIIYPNAPENSLQAKPDFQYIHKELLKHGVTLRLLWEEYVASCRESSKAFYQYSRFCDLYREYVAKNHLTMHINHKPGDRIMVDWAGETLTLYGEHTNKKYKAYLFVATLPFSMYSYAEACIDMKEASWINANIHMMKYFGGASRLLIPDNLKTGILSHKKYEDPVANKAYQEFADHFGMALLPARVVTPKDKAAVEGSVGVLTTHIIAKLRNRKFFSISEMNQEIAVQLKYFNEEPFQKREGSRSTVFHEEELPFLSPIPLVPYEYAIWSHPTVLPNYHVVVEHQNYSVPYNYVGKKVNARLTSMLVEVICNGTRIACHKRIYGHRGQYSTVVEHMPPNHQLYSEWNGNRFRRWASSIGEAVYTVIDRLLSNYRVEEQAYKGCIGILKLNDKYGGPMLEQACALALTKMTVPNYKAVHDILTAIHKTKGAIQDDKAIHNNSNAMVRGASYYGGGNNGQ